MGTFCSRANTHENVVSLYGHSKCTLAQVDSGGSCSSNASHCRRGDDARRRVARRPCGHVPHAAYLRVIARSHVVVCGHVVRVNTTYLWRFLCGRRRKTNKSRKDGKETPVPGRSVTSASVHLRPAPAYALTHGAHSVHVACVCAVMAQCDHRPRTPL